ncbi:MAG: hypothetical protein NW205_05300 [Hyphomicrobiaceae bacterium]|nr:hypothetical protein [Hyphomicrobiaceae bacterium]
MAELEALFRSGAIAVVVLAVMVVEAVLLVAWARRRDMASWRREAALIAANLASGAGLVLSLRAALIGAPWTEVAGFLLVSFAAHIADVVLRYARRR